MKAFLLGVIVTLAVGVAAVFVYFGRGFAPVATAAPAMPFEKMLASWALHARVDKEMPKTVPIDASEANLVAGAHLYMENCAVCHGVPGKKQTAIARGEFPQPPQLVTGHGVTDDPPGETYWKTANGIRLTGMPSFDKSLTDTQIWQVSLLLANAQKLPPSASAVLSGPPEVPSAN
jgi:thiosulfate dehydrogenase